MKHCRSVMLVLAATVLLMVFAAGCGAGSDAHAESGSEASETMTVDGGLDLTLDDVRLVMSSEGDNLSVELSAPTTGWVAVGFDPSAAMKDANIVIGYVADGEVFLRDDWGSGHTSHEPDTEMGGTDDIIGASGSEENGVTSISFSIPLDSGTPGDKALVAGTVYDVLLAYGPDDADDFEGYHRWAEIVEIEF